MVDLFDAAFVNSDTTGNLPITAALFVEGERDGEVERGGTIYGNGVEAATEGGRRNPFMHAEMRCLMGWEGGAKGEREGARHVKGEGQGGKGGKR